MAHGWTDRQVLSGKVMVKSLNSGVRLQLEFQPCQLGNVRHYGGDIFISQRPLILTWQLGTIKEPHLIGLLVG